MSGINNKLNHVLLGNGIRLEYESIRRICSKYMIRQFSIFGSSLRQDFNADSDIDVLVSFSEEASVSLFDLIDIENELEIIFGRHVDLVEKESLKNPIRRENILRNMETIYAA
jgi:predicted nucleotidyltransferase